jgi:hypothetical protein
MLGEHLITTSPNFVPCASEFLIAQLFTFSAIALGNEFPVAASRMTCS